MYSATEGEGICVKLPVSLTVCGHLKKKCTTSHQLGEEKCMGLQATSDASCCYMSKPGHRELYE